MYKDTDTKPQSKHTNNNTPPQTHDELLLELELELLDNELEELNDDELLLVAELELAHAHEQTIPGFSSIVWWLAWIVVSVAADWKALDFKNWDGLTCLSERLEFLVVPVML